MVDRLDLLAAGQRLLHPVPGAGRLPGGAAKPDPRFSQLACGRRHVPARVRVYVGDRLQVARGSCHRGGVAPYLSQPVSGAVLPGSRRSTTLLKAQPVRRSATALTAAIRFVRIAVADPSAPSRSARRSSRGRIRVHTSEPQAEAASRGSQVSATTAPHGASSPPAGPPRHQGEWGRWSQARAGAGRPAPHRRRWPCHRITGGPSPAYTPSRGRLPTLPGRRQPGHGNARGAPVIPRRL